METQITHQPSFAVATLTLGAGEQVRVEGGAMNAMSSGMEIETKATGGIGKAFKRSFLGGESFFMNTFTAGVGGGWIQVAPTLPGDIATIDLEPGRRIFVRSGSFMASEMDVSFDTKWGGAKSFFGGSGLFLLKCEGQGDMIVSSYGALDRFTLEAGHSITVDSGHVVAFDASVQYDVRKVGGWKSTILSGEGLVVELTGPGEVMTQTRSEDDLEAWVKSVVPTQSNR